jgi:uncharacterized protein YeaO (DUF488 family)
VAGPISVERPLCAVSGRQAVSSGRRQGQHLGGGHLGVSTVLKIVSGSSFYGPPARCVIISGIVGRRRSSQFGASLMITKVPAGNIKLKRAYDPPDAGDGKRILIDRLWPRGVSKERAALNQWMKEIAPSTDLRKWFGHDPSRWGEFRRRYAEEVRQHPDLLDQLRVLAREGPVTLVYSAHDEMHNDAVELRNIVLSGS